MSTHNRVFHMQYLVFCLLENMLLPSNSGPLVIVSKREYQYEMRRRGKERKPDWYTIAS